MTASDQHRCFLNAYLLLSALKAVEAEHGGHIHCPPTARRVQTAVSFLLQESNTHKEPINKHEETSMLFRCRRRATGTEKRDSGVPRSLPACRASQPAALSSLPSVPSQASSPRLPQCSAFP